MMVHHVHCGVRIFMPSRMAAMTLPPMMPSKPNPPRSGAGGSYTAAESGRSAIEEHRNVRPDAVVALAALAIHVADGDFADRGAIPSWQEPE